MVLCNVVVSPVHQQWSYHGLALSHGYVNCIKEMFWCIQNFITDYTFDYKLFWYFQSICLFQPHMLIAKDGQDLTIVLLMKYDSLLNVSIFHYNTRNTKKCLHQYVLHNTLFSLSTFLNTLRGRQHGRHFADGTFKLIFLTENVIISIKISLKFVPRGPINNIPTLVQVMAWLQLGDKPLSEPMMVSLLMAICVTRPQWVNAQCVKGGAKWQSKGFHKGIHLTPVLRVYICYICCQHFDNHANHTLLTHLPLGDVAVILKVCFLNSLAWAFAVKLLSGECHRTSLMKIQHWLR